MAFTTDFNFISHGKLNYKDKDLKYYVSYRPNINHDINYDYMKNIFYKTDSAESRFIISNIATANRVAGGKTTSDACDCVGQGVDIGYSGMFNAITADGNDTFLKAGYNPHLIFSGDTNTSLIYKTAYSGAKNNYDDDNSDLFRIKRYNSKLAIDKYYGTTAGWREYAAIPANSFDKGLIPYVFMFYVQAAGGGGGPSYWESGGGGGGGGSAVIFMYKFTKYYLYIQLGAPGKGGYYNGSPQGGSGSTSLIYDDDESHNFSIRVGAGFGASGTDQWITKGGRGGYVSFGRRVSNFQGMTLSDFNSAFKDTCFIMCYGDGGRGGNASRVSTGEPATAATGATMTYTDAVTNYTFAHDGGKTAFGGGGGGSPTSTGMAAPIAANKPGNSASDSDRGNGGSGASSKGVAVISSAGGDGGTSEFQIWY